MHLNVGWTTLKVWVGTPHPLKLQKWHDLVQETYLKVGGANTPTLHTIAWARQKSEGGWGKHTHHSTYRNGEQRRSITRWVGNHTHYTPTWVWGNCGSGKESNLKMGGHGHGHSRSCSTRMTFLTVFQRSPEIFFCSNIC